MMGNMNINIKIDNPRIKETPFESNNSYNNYGIKMNNTYPGYNQYNYYGSGQNDSQYNNYQEPYEQSYEGNYCYMQE